MLLPDEINESEMSAAFVICSASTDREGDIIDPQGCRDHLDEYKANPIVLFDHNHDAGGPGYGGTTWAPIGLSEDKDGRFSLRISDDKITARCYFHGLPFKGHNLSEEVFHLVVKGALRGASVGFLPLEAESIGYGRDAGKHYHKWRLTEWSITPLQSNQDCLRACLSRGEIKTKSLVDSLSRYLPPAPVWSPGATLEDVHMAKRRVAAVHVSKSLYPTRAVAVAKVKQLGRDASSCTDTADAWVFAQSLDDVDPTSRRDLTKGIFARYAVVKALPDDEDEKKDYLDEKMVTKDTDEDTEEADEADEVSADDQEAEEAETTDDETPDEVTEDETTEQADHTGKQGAKDLAVLQEHFDHLLAALPDIMGRNENPAVVKAIQQVQAMGAKLHQAISECAQKAYPGLDLDSLKGQADVTPEDPMDDPTPDEAVESMEDETNGVGSGVEADPEAAAVDPDEDEDDIYKSIAKELAIVSKKLSKVPSLV